MRVDVRIINKDDPATSGDSAMNAVELAVTHLGHSMKRMVSGVPRHVIRRQSVFKCWNDFHSMLQGLLASTGRVFHRRTNAQRRRNVSTDDGETFERILEYR